MKFNFFFFGFNKKIGNIVDIQINDFVDYENNDDEFNLVFNEDLKSGLNCKQITFGDLSKSFETLIVYKQGKPIKKLKLHYSYWSSSKLEAIKFNKFIAIGISGFFYLYDLSNETIVLYIDLFGFFCGFEVADEKLLLTYNAGIYCLNKYGQILWHNKNFGIDGVYVNEVKNGVICGTEQLDPPEGWEDFKLDMETGKRLDT